MEATRNRRARVLPSVLCFLPSYLALAILLMTGCTNHERPPIQPQTDPYDSQQVHVDSNRLQNDILVGRIIRSRDQAGILHIVVPVRSFIDKELHVQYRLRFFDRNHSVVSEISWSDKNLAANTPDQIEGNSSGPNADDFQLDLRYPPGY